MLKIEAIKILGGSASSAARAVGVTPQAVSAWPDVLTDAIRDRVQAALYRESSQNITHPSVARSFTATESVATE
jgi:hypothetical protein